MYDVAIVGAGPAGATLARCLDPGLKVLLLEKRSIGDGARRRPKPCGGLLAPDAQEALSAMGLSLPPSIMVRPQLSLVRAVDCATGLEAHYHRSYLNLDRDALERWLISLVPGSVETRFGACCESFTRDGASFSVRIRGEGITSDERARLVVGADGASSPIRRMLGASQAWPRRYIAIQERFPLAGTPRCFGTFFDTEVTDFYGWTIPKDGSLVVGAAIPAGPGAEAKFSLLKKRLSTLGYELGRGVGKEVAYISRPVSRTQICTGQDSVLLIGEAAGWISPSSAEGLSYAFRSARAAAQAIGRSVDGCLERYRSLTRGLARSIGGKNLKSIVMYTPALRQMVIRSGLLKARVH